VIWLLASLVLLQARPEVIVNAPRTAVTARPGGSVEITLEFIIPQGYHINSNKPTEEYLIPTRVEWTAGALKHQADTFPPPVLKSFAFAPNKKLSVFEGVQKLKSRFAVPAGAPGPVTLEGKFRYQACDDAVCYPPRTTEFKVPVQIRS
jgi:hypothetical protein